MNCFYNTVKKYLLYLCGSIDRFSMLFHWSIFLECQEILHSPYFCGFIIILKIDSIIPPFFQICLSFLDPLYFHRYFRIKLSKTVHKMLLSPGMKVVYTFFRPSLIIVSTVFFLLSFGFLIALWFSVECWNSAREWQACFVPSMRWAVMGQCNREAAFNISPLSMMLHK